MDQAKRAKRELVPTREHVGPAHAVSFARCVWKSFRRRAAAGVVERRRPPETLAKRWATQCAGSYRLRRSGLDRALREDVAKAADVDGLDGESPPDVRRLRLRRAL